VTSTERQSDNLLLIAAREPASGFAKTRLGETIGMERAATLYRAFLGDLAVRFASSGDAYQLAWAYTPTECDFRALIGRMNARAVLPPVRFVDQIGETWGERQTNLLRWGDDQGYARTVLIASDSPQLPRSIVLRAFENLRSHDVTFGRVHDGGYYLIGLRGFHDVLSGVPMSTSSAADALAARNSALGLTYAELPGTFDIDVEHDLDLLIAALAPDGAAAPRTWHALHALGLIDRSLRMTPRPTLAFRD
jgi:glycosyltransferase A (GT-A) superfamily protein (DUF2064 family)